MKTRLLVIALYGLLTILFMPLSAFAYQQYKIIEATSDLPDEMNYRTELFIRTDESGQILGIFKRDTPFEQGQDLDEKFFSYQEVIDGAVLLKRDGRDIIILQLDTFDPYNGGDFKLRYLRNGITMSYRDKDFSLDVHRGRWAVYQASGHLIKEVFVKTNWYFLFGCVGIEQIISGPCEKNSAPC